MLSHFFPFPFLLFKLRHMSSLQFIKMIMFFQVSESSLVDSGLSLGQLGLRIRCFHVSIEYR